MKKLLYIFLFIHFLTTAQHTIATNVGRTKLDFFHGVTYSYSYQRMDVHAGAAYGIVKTFFHPRFFPKLTLGVSFNPIKRTRFQLGPTLQYDFSQLSYMHTKNGRAQYHEIGTGLKWNYGTNWKIGQTLLIGGLWESSYSTIYNKRLLHGTWGYLIQIDLSYAF